MPSEQIKAGDKLKCVDNGGGILLLTVHKEYTALSNEDWHSVRVCNDRGEDSFSYPTQCFTGAGESENAVEQPRVDWAITELRRWYHKGQSGCEAIEIIDDTIRKHKQELAALQSRITELEAQVGKAEAERDEAKCDHGDFLAFMHAELSAMGCCCEVSTHDATPPMMWPEWIGCIIRKRVSAAQAQLGEMREKYGKLYYEYISPIVDEIFGPQVALTSPPSQPDKAKIDWMEPLGKLVTAGNGLAAWNNNVLDDPQACQEYKDAVSKFLSALELFDDEGIYGIDKPASAAKEGEPPIGPSDLDCFGTALPPPIQWPSITPQHEPAKPAERKGRWFKQVGDDDELGPLRYDPSTGRVWRMNPDGTPRYSTGYTINQLVLNESDFIECDHTGKPLAQPGCCGSGEVTVDVVEEQAKSLWRNIHPSRGGNKLLTDTQRRNCITMGIFVASDFIPCDEEGNPLEQAEQGCVRPERDGQSGETPAGNHSPGHAAVSEPAPARGGEQLATIGQSCGRCYLDVAGISLALQGDFSRHHGLEWTEDKLRNVAAMINKVSAPPAKLPAEVEKLLDEIEDYAAKHLSAQSERTLAHIVSQLRAAFTAMAQKTNGGQG